MYSASLKIDLIGFSNDDAESLRKLPPLDPICYDFSISSIDALSANRDSDLIIINCQCLNDSNTIRHAIDLEDSVSKIVLIAPQEMFEELGESVSGLYDFWTGPLSERELVFHFNKLIEKLKLGTDLWETRHFLDTTIDSIPSMIWYKTRDGIHEKVNKSFCDTVNKTREQVQGQRHAYIWDVEADDPVCIESENIVMSSGDTLVSDERIQVGDAEKLLTTYKSPLYNLDGSVMGTVGVGIDVTQEKMYESDLLEKSRSLETIFTTLDCGVLTHSMDGSRVLGVNKKALDLLGYESEQELADSGFDMVASTVVDEDAKRLRREMANLTEVGDSLSTEYRVQHEDGEMLHIMGNIKVIEKDGERYYQRFLLDITEQKALQRQQERRSHDLIQALSEDYLVVCTFDIGNGVGEVLRVTKDDAELAQIFNGPLSLNDTISTYINARVHNEDIEMMSTALSVEEILKELKLKNRFDKLYRTRRDGMVRFRQITVVRSGNWNDKNEVVMGFRNVDQQIRDELEQKTLLEEALANAKKANEAKSSFLLNMSHDIRTPMNAIVGFSSLAANHLDQMDKVADYLSKIQSSSDHLLNLINDILDVSRIEQGKLSLEEDRCDVTEILRDLYEMLRSVAENKGLTFGIDTSNVVHSEIVCDRLKLNQVILNLLGNAIKFTDAGGEVNASIEELPGGSDGFGIYRIIVEDTGMGMPADFLDLIFDPFERVKSPTVSGIQGSGLGMAIVKSLVDMMGGTIEVESELGEGTRFTVNLTFEIATGDSSDEAEETKEPVLFTPERASKYHILLVDDNPVNREIAEDILLDAGFRVDEAENGLEALNKVKESGGGYYDLVLMDIQMPVMNGYEAATAIRSLEDKSLAEIPILAVTADAFEEDRRRALDHGMNGHLPKPIEITRLFEFLDSLLD